MGKKSKEITPENIILQRRRHLRDLQLLFSGLRKLFVLLLVIAILFGLIFGLTPMKGSDMEPRLSAGDLLLYYRLEKEYARDDIVLMEREGKQYVGRLIGLPGDVLIIKENGIVQLNGYELVEPGIFFETMPVEDEVKYPVILEDGQYFILGDQRDSARDSRYFGTVLASELKGKVLTAIRRVSV